MNEHSKTGDSICAEVLYPPPGKEKELREQQWVPLDWLQGMEDKEHGILSDLRGLHRHRPSTQIL